jgi:hypothetical protein
LTSPHWQGWLGKRNRCIVPATSFCEYADTKPRKTPIWFALAEERPLFAFAGLWTRWRGVRGPKSAPVEGEHQIFGFLTTEANAFIAPIHSKAMPVILTKRDEFDRWLEANMLDALELQRPLPDEATNRRERRERGWRRSVIRIAITAAAYEAIAAALQRRIQGGAHRDRQVVLNPLTAERRRGEDYSDTIIRLAAVEAQR